MHVNVYTSRPTISLSAYTMHGTQAGKIKELANRHGGHNLGRRCNVDVDAVVVVVIAVVVVVLRIECFYGTAMTALQRLSGTPARRQREKEHAKFGCCCC